MILILGTTASGKSRLAFELAKKIDAEIISIDSMKIYRRMDIGTAKPSKENRRQVKYHLIDVVEPSESFSVADFLAATEKVVEEIKSRGKTVIAAGGTSLYIKVLLFGLFEGPGSDEKIREKLKSQVDKIGLGKLHEQLAKIDSEAALRIHPNDARRIIRALEVYDLTGKPISSFQSQWDTKPNHNWKIIGLRRDKDIESGRINARVKKMVELGLVDEVKSLLAEVEPLSKQAAAAIGYAEIIEHLNSKLSLDEAIEKIKINTRRLAKSQRGWMKTFTDVNWLDIEDGESDEHILNRTCELL